MTDRTIHLIESLGLTAHPEGGYFVEIFRSEEQVTPQDKRGNRSALTTIFFLLTAGQTSRLHMVKSDEVWHFMEGDPLELFEIGADLTTRKTHLLDSMDSQRDGTQPVHIIKANSWQAARSTGAYTLVGCTVGPGFDFEDFEMASSNSEKERAITARFPDWAHLVSALIA